jgi:hypothetical protein
MHTVQLTRVFRQSDADFVAHLQAIRQGRNVAAAMAAIAQRCSRPLPELSGIKPTELYATNKEVGTVNEDALRRLAGPPTGFTAADEQSSVWALADGRKLTDAEQQRNMVRAAVRMPAVRLGFERCLPVCSCHRCCCSATTFTAAAWQRRSWS